MRGGWVMGRRGAGRRGAGLACSEECECGSRLSRHRSRFSSSGADPARVDIMAARSMRSSVGNHAGGGRLSHAGTGGDAAGAASGEGGASLRRGVRPLGPRHLQRGLRSCA